MGSIAQERQIQVSALWVFPIKSCKGISVQSWGYNESGLDFDRQWMIVEERTHGFLTARTIPRMILIEPTLDLQKRTITISIPEYRDFPASSHTIPIDPVAGKDEEHSDLRVWSSLPLDGWEVGNAELNRALSHYMGKEVRLMKKGVGRRECGPMNGYVEALRAHGVDLEYDEPDSPACLGWADEFPITLLSESSLLDVHNRALTDEELRARPHFDKERWAHGAPLLEITRFRGNIIVKGSEKWEEDGWCELRFEQEGFEPETLYAVFRLARCMLPNVDPATGIRDKVVPDSALRPYRERLWRDSPKAFFGQNLVPKRSKGVLRVGDRVAVVTRFESDGKGRFKRPEDEGDF
ncbi:hypothetical protein T439DRAFT_327688 [Meredithblackwellia eburnea MCA 4105]